MTNDNDTDELRQTNENHDLKLVTPLRVILGNNQMK